MSHGVSIIAGKATLKGDTAAHELIAHLGAIEDERTLAAEKALGPKPNEDPPVGHSFECTNLGDKSYIAEKTKKAILGLMFETGKKANEAHVLATIVGIYSVFMTKAVEVVKATENL